MRTFFVSNRFGTQWAVIGLILRSDPLALVNARSGTLLCVKSARLYASDLDRFHGVQQAVDVTGQDTFQRLLDREILWS